MLNIQWKKKLTVLHRWTEMLNVKLSLQQSHLQETRMTLTSFVNQFWALFTHQGSVGWV